MGRRLLLVDIGNSQVKWGRAEAGRIVAGPPFPSAPLGLAERLGAYWRALAVPEAVYVSNVAGIEIENELTRWVAGYWKVPLRFARAEAARCGVVNGYERPEQLGADRWTGLIGLRRHFELPAGLADCGTALTFDVLDAGGRHLGGLIAPGLGPMKDALLRETRGVKAVDSGTRTFLGRNTAAGVESGVIRAGAGLVEKSAREASERLGRPLTLVLSGGDAAAIGDHLAIPFRLDAELTLRGLLALAENDV